MVEGDGGVIRLYKRLYLQDLGGHGTVDGGRLKTGLLYRSADLSRLRARDRAHLQEVGIRHIIDLREPKAVARRPDRFRPEHVTLLPVHLGEFHDIRGRDVLLGRVDWSRYNLDRLYVNMVEENREALRRFLEALIDRPRPALLHCTAGKDRTGVFSAVLQLALGVSEEAVMQAYLDIASHVRRSRSALARFMLDRLGVPELVHTVVPETMQELLAYIRRRYGGIAGLLRDIGFGRLEELRAVFSV